VNKLALINSGVYILENTLHPLGRRKNISRCNLGEKYEKG
jgi:hypothetical protein